MENGARVSCPQCGSDMPVIPGYVTWCDQCDWNLNPERVSSHERLADKLNRKIGVRAVQRLYDSIMTAGVEFRITPSIVAAYLAATVLHGLTILLFYLGIERLVTPYNFGEFLSGLLMTAVAFEIRPRFYRFKRKPIHRSDYPVIYELLDELAERTGARRIDSVVALPEFTAFFMRSGLLRKRLIGIGIPLFAGLTVQEKIHVLAHEMAHNAHNDNTRNWYVESALYFLSQNRLLGTFRSSRHPYG
ncbi:M48 family metallopeptidase [Paenibacillus sp. sptzw28]|uniref:M48 family metallopeptidase n=1 Tax=Paenibacillus sp. sptzw28 TaxID=715179 RepID=UPI001C6DD8FA|nr:M48 family metallopeptidase [Paenibacillus sp. sptzw28]QYR19295.1 M48 family metallopeptidase [Paenibacillus sp. sptzw28]